MTPAESGARDLSVQFAVRLVAPAMGAVRGMVGAVQTHPAIVAKRLAAHQRTAPEEVSSSSISGR